MLPTVIIFESHVDTKSKEVILNNLDQLKKCGYDTLCFEYPNEKSGSEITQDLKAQIESAEKLEQTALQFMAARGIKRETLQDLKYAELCELVHLFVSSRHYESLSLTIKGITGLKKSYELMQKATQLDITIHGLDIDAERYNLLNTPSLKEKIKQIDHLAVARDQCMAKNLINLSKENRGIVFLCGLDHKNALLKLLDEMGHLKKVLQYTVYSDRVTDDFGKDALQPYLVGDNLFRITDDNQDTFIQQLNTDIRKATPETEFKQYVSLSTSPLILFPDHEKQARTLYNEALSAFENLNYLEGKEKALKSALLFEIIKGKASLAFGKCHALLASCFRELKDFDQAVSSCETALEIYSQHNADKTKLIKKYQQCLALQAQHSNQKSTKPAV